MDVIRCDRTGTIKAGGKFYRTQACVNIAMSKIIASGSINPAFDMPPFFFTGSPYGDAIRDLGADEVAQPVGFTASCVPQNKVAPWRSRAPSWPDVFGVNPELYEATA